MHKVMVVAIAKGLLAKRTLERSLRSPPTTLRLLLNYPKGQLDCMRNPRQLSFCEKLTFFDQSTCDKAYSDVPHNM